ncbi:MAG: PIN domain-containing protein [Gemmataceae bacterium]|nr:PIN domain-containing protein [Gemmataceae bacterium]
MIFADTGGLFAAFVPNDLDHPAADAWLAANTEPLVATDYVVDELLTLLKIRSELQRALHLGQQVLTEEILDMAWVTPGDVHQAWEVYRKYPDQAWSFTDCVSRVIMERLGIQTAFSFDKHFRQFGTVTVVP